jgi:hypothetical protein
MTTIRNTENRKDRAWWSRARRAGLAIGIASGLMIAGGGVAIATSPGPGTKSPGARWSQGRPALSHVYSTSQSVVHMYDDRPTEVAQLALPAGNYLLSAKLQVDVLDTTVYADTTCRLYVNYTDSLDNPIDMDEHDAMNHDRPEAWPLEGTVYYDKAGWAVLGCLMDPNDTTSQIIGTVSNIVLIATTVGAIN